MPFREAWRSSSLGEKPDLLQPHWLCPARLQPTSQKGLETQPVSAWLSLLCSGRERATQALLPRHPRSSWAVYSGELSQIAAEKQVCAPPASNPLLHLPPTHLLSAGGRCCAEAKPVLVTVSSLVGKPQHEPGAVEGHTSHSSVSLEGRDACSGSALMRKQCLDTD